MDADEKKVQPNYVKSTAWIKLMLKLNTNKNM